ncbi:hypothetical protein BSKO_06221 [Bryopsis sp. KO-2023]|nr:hypothetical protein BSKO_06221 [Bryopsis sp. KO-2023]
MATDAKWYYLADGQPSGPHRTGDMADLFKAGTINRETMCWTEGRPQWQCAEGIAELDAAFGAVEEIAKKSRHNAQTLASDDPLAAFQQEIAALESGQQAEASDQPDPDSSTMETPASPDEKSFVDDDGTEYEWDSIARKYAPKGGQALKEGNGDAGRGRQNYDVEDMTFEAELEEQPSLAEAKKRIQQMELEEEARAVMEANEDEEGSKRKKGKGEKKQDEKKQGEKRPAEEPAPSFSEPSKTTSVYITGLPDDVTLQELVNVFNKCGIIKTDEDMVPKVKIYRDKATGMVKGDGLVTYLKRPSVELAINILDKTPFRPNMGMLMKVQEARFQVKGDFKPRPSKKKKKPKGKKDRQANLLGWGGFDDRLSASKITVILKHMFHPDEMIGDPDAATELEAEIKEECEKIGAVDRVNIYQHNPDGVVAIRFESEEATELCVKKMNNRFFGGRMVEASKWDGFTKYNVKPKQTEEEEAERLEKFAKDLEADNTAAGTV